MKVLHEFLSTPSARRATLRGLSFRLPAVEFLSTPSARRATGMPDNYKGPAQFLSTPSARRATGLLTEDDIAEVISIHALREEGDRSGKSGRAEF